MCVLPLLDFEILKVRDSTLFFPESRTLCGMLVTRQMFAEELNKNMYKEQN